MTVLFEGHLNGHHQEWLGSVTTNRHGVAAFDFSTVSDGCDQLVVSPTHAHGGTLDLLMTDVPDLVWAAVVALIGNSDHSSLSVVISMAQAATNMCVSRKVFLKHHVNWNAVCGAICQLPWHNIRLSDNPLEVLNEHAAARVGAAWEKQKEIASLLVNRGIPLHHHGIVYEACIRSVMLYGGETWALTARLEGILLSCDRRMLRYMAGVTWGDCVRSEEVWGEGVGGCAEGEKVAVVRACGEKGGDLDLGKDSACCDSGAAATWKT